MVYCSEEHTVRQNVKKVPYFRPLLMPLLNFPRHFKPLVITLN